MTRQTLRGITRHQQRHEKSLNTRRNMGQKKRRQGKQDETWVRRKEDKANKTKHGSEEKKTRQTRRNIARHNKTRDTTAPDKKKHESEDKKKDTAHKTRDKTTARQIRRNKRFPEITGEDNLTVFSYFGRVKSPKWRWQRRRADLRHFEIFRHGPIIINTRLPAGGTYPICTFPASSECLIGISDAFSAFLFTGIRHLPHVLTVPPNKSVPTLRYTRRHGPTYTGPCPKALTECSPLFFPEDRLFESDEKTRQHKLDEQAET